jgi:hypothetical protein
MVVVAQLPYGQPCIRMVQGLRDGPMVAGSWVVGPTSLYTPYPHKPKSV